MFTDPTIMPAPYNDFVFTKVTYSAGAQWQEIPVPTQFKHFECNSCKTAINCHLQLHGPSSWHYGIGAWNQHKGLLEHKHQFLALCRQPCMLGIASARGHMAQPLLTLKLVQPAQTAKLGAFCQRSTPIHHSDMHERWPADARPSFYSNKAAPGLVMATGNTGRYLKVGTNAPTCTWISHDGGLTWQDVANFASIYEFGDFGATIVMAQHLTDGPTSEVYFSVDQGACWSTVFLSEPIDIQNIRCDSGAALDTHDSKA